MERSIKPTSNLFSLEVVYLHVQLDWTHGKAFLVIWYEVHVTYPSLETLSLAFLQDIPAGASGAANAGTADGSSLEEAGATLQQQPQEEQASMDRTCSSPVYDIGEEEEEDEEIEMADIAAPEPEGGEALGGDKGDNVYIASADGQGSLDFISAMLRGSTLTSPHSVKVRFDCKRVLQDA